MIGGNGNKSFNIHIMKIIFKGDARVIKFLGKQNNNSNLQFRPSIFTISQPVDNGILLFNTLTCSLLLLSSTEYRNMLNMHVLRDAWFIVPMEFDDYQLSCQIKNLISMTRVHRHSIIGYTILTTTDCNARCFYCYEKGVEKKTMTIETADLLSDYITKNYNKHKVSLSWFGGEPLFNIKVIDRITQNLERNGVEFGSTMVTNGYLFSPGIVGRAASLWHLRNVQITIDGTENIYNRTKAFIYEGINAYHRVMSNIKLLLDHQFEVSIRINVDVHNADDVLNLIHNIKSDFDGYQNLSVYSHALFETSTSGTAEHRSKVYIKRKEISREIKALGLDHPYNLPNKLPEHLCMADDDESVVVSPDGKLGKCEHYVDRGFYGSLQCDIIDRNALNRFSEVVHDKPECHQCFYHPHCKILKLCCQNECTPEQVDEHLNDFKDSMVNAYRIFLEKNNDDKN